VQARVRALVEKHGMQFELCGFAEATGRVLARLKKVARMA
jgi:hypothetical protein